MFAAAVLACALPTLSTLSAPPSSTLFNQAAAIVGWGLWACGWAVWASQRPHELGGGYSRSVCGPLWVAWLVLVLCVTISGVRGLPLGLALSALGMLAAAGLALMFGHAVARDGWADAAFTALCRAWVLASVLNTAVALLQVLAPQAVDGLWLAQTSAAIAGRGAGNFRQPNHLSSFLLCGLVAAIWLHTRRNRAIVFDGVWWGLMLWLCVGLVSTGSRTGALGLVVLAVWGGMDRRLSAQARIGLLVALVLYALLTWGWSVWLQGGRLGVQGDLSASRFGIWSNIWVLIQEHPWIGVGWGGLNWAWTLTSFPGRPVAFFDHAHNLPLHFAVELGVPLALLLCTLLGWALWRAVVGGWRLAGSSGVMATAAAMMVLVMALHSQFEYPLWYAYFLLPIAFVWGLSLALAAPVSTPPKTPLPGQRLGLMVLGALVAVGALGATLDYLRVVVIFAPTARSGPLAQRIEAGQRSVFFSHQAHYAHATTHVRPEAVLPSIRLAAHNLIDTRLLTVWAQAYAAQGDIERARYLAQRLREFRPNDAFFDSCRVAASAKGETPFQCMLPSRSFTPDGFVGAD